MRTKGAKILRARGNRRSSGGRANVWADGECTCASEAGGRVRARQSHDLTGAGELRRGINVTSHGVGMLLAGTWLRGTGFERAIERAPEDRATSHGRDGRELRNLAPTLLL